MSRLVRLGGLLLGITASVYFAAFAYRAAARLDPRSLGSPPILLAIVVAAIGYASVIPTSSWAWGRLLRGAGVSFPTLRLSMILGMSQIAKYVPGNVGHHLGRSAMSIQRGIPAPAVLATLVTEALLAIAAAVVVGVVALAVAGRGVTTTPVSRPGGVVVVVLSLASLLAGLWIAGRRAPALSRWLAQHPGAARPSGPAVRGALAAAFLAYLANHVVVGAGLYALGFAVAQSPPETAPLFVGAFALSWVLGFVVPGAPAGLGVREGVLAALLAPTLDGGAALRVIVAFRVATTLGDILGLAWGAGIWLVERRASVPTRSVAGERGGE